MFEKKEPMSENRNARKRKYGIQEKRAIICDVLHGNRKGRREEMAKYACDFLNERLYPHRQGEPIVGRFHGYDIRVGRFHVDLFGEIRIESIDDESYVDFTKRVAPYVDSTYIDMDIEEGRDPCEEDHVYFTIDAEGVRQILLAEHGRQKRLDPRHIENATKVCKMFNEHVDFKGLCLLGSTISPLQVITVHNIEEICLSTLCIGDIYVVGLGWEDVNMTKETEKKKLGTERVLGFPKQQQKFIQLMVPYVNDSYLDVRGIGDEMYFIIKAEGVEKIFNNIINSRRVFATEDALLPFRRSQPPSSQSDDGPFNRCVGNILFDRKLLDEIHRFLPSVDDV